MPVNWPSRYSISDPDPFCGLRLCRHHRQRPFSEQNLNGGQSWTRFSASGKGNHGINAELEHYNFAMAAHSDRLAQLHLVAD
jgi:hypothetical protein